MNAGQMERWLGRERVRAVKLGILATSLAKEPEPVHEWTCDELNATSNRAGAVLDTCSDYATCKGESVQFRLEFYDHNDHVITATTHRAAPDDADPNDPRTDADIGVNGLIAQFMRHDEMREKVMVGAMSSFFGAAEKIVSMQTKLLEQSNLAQQLLIQQLQAARERSDGAADTREPTEEERAEALARANAYNKAAELAPVLFEAVLRTWNHVQAANTNGHSKAAA